MVAKTKTPRKKTVKKIRKKEEKKAKKVDIGIDVKIPENRCEDKNCPFHGKLAVRGQIITGIVVSDKMDRSVVVQREYMRYIKKYERSEKRTRKYLAHLPLCIKAHVGNEVKIMECRPLSKTISYVVIESN